MNGFTTIALAILVVCIVIMAINQIYLSWRWHIIARGREKEEWLKDYHKRVDMNRDEWNGGGYGF